MSDEIWVAVIATVGVIAVPTINHLAQLRKSRQAGVTSEDVRAHPPDASPDPGESWERLVHRLEKRIERLDKRVEKVEAEVKVERDLRWLAIQHIRALYAWITQHIPGVDPPAVPDDLAPYIIVPRKDHSS